MRSVLLISVVICFGSVVESPVLAQQSRCADCHFANPQADPDPDHLRDWERSPHGREQVGCESCHGGNATTTESFLAHQGILGSRNPGSPNHRANLPGTCGQCHIGPFVAFQKSRHFELLEGGDNDGPTCSTCHGDVGADLLSPRRLEKQCASCHGPEGAQPREGAALEARVLMEEVENVRVMLKTASGLIRHVEGEARRGELERDYEQAEVPLREAVAAGHAFIFDPDRERLRTARERTELLLNALANPQ